MSVSRRHAALLAVLVAVSLAGCAVLPGGGVDPADYDADQLQSDAIAATEDADQYAFAFEQTFTTETESGSLTLGVGANGTADEPAERTGLEFRTWIGQPEAGIDAEAYHVGETVYHRSAGGEWNGTDAAAGYWAPKDRDVALLDGANATVDGTESVEGRETVVLAVEPASDDSIARYGLDQALVQDVLHENVSVESATVRQYVAPGEPHRIVRTEVDVTFVSTGSEFEGSLATTYDYDGGSVTLPDDLPE